MILILLLILHYLFIYFYKLHKFASGTARKILPFISLMPLTYTVIEHQLPGLL